MESNGAIAGIRNVRVFLHAFKRLPNAPGLHSPPQEHVREEKAPMPFRPRPEGETINAVSAALIP